MEKNIIDVYEDVCTIPPLHQKEVIELINTTLKTFVDKEILWKVSAKSMLLGFNCTLDGILNGCMGCCCGFPPSDPRRTEENSCKHLGDHGCTLEMKDRPVLCLTYPLHIKNGVLKIYGRTPWIRCKKNYTKKEDMTPTSIRLIDSCKATFSHLFTEDAYNYVKAATNLVIDPYIIVQKEVADNDEIMKDWVRDGNGVGKLRSEYGIPKDYNTTLEKVYKTLIKYFSNISLSKIFEELNQIFESDPNSTSMRLLVMGTIFPMLKEEV